MIPKCHLITSPNGAQAPENRLNWQIWAPKVEPRHAFAIPVLTTPDVVLDSDSIEQNTGAKELRLPLARDAI